MDHQHNHSHEHGHFQGTSDAQNSQVMHTHQGQANDQATNGAASTTAPAKPAKKLTESEQVTMEDNRVLEFAGKKRMHKTSFPPKLVTPEDGAPSYWTAPQVRLDFRNGKSILFTLPESLIYQFALHGAEQKLGDETAGTEDVDDMFLDVEALCDRLNKGEWSTQREAGGMAGTSVLLRALVEITGKTTEEIKAFLKDKSPKEKLALRASPKIKPTIDRIEAEKAAKSAHIDTEALLASVGI